MGDKADRHEREEQNNLEDERNVPVLPLGDYRQCRLVQKHFSSVLCMPGFDPSHCTWLRGGYYSTHGASSNGLEGGTPTEG
jgi:hypothetical protein